MQSEIKVLARSCLKPMQPMQLYWAPRFWAPSAMSLGRLCIFSDTPCARDFSRNRLWISLLANKVLVWTNDEFPLIIIERYQTCSIPKALYQGLLNRQGRSACVTKRAHATASSHRSPVCDAFSRAARIFWAICSFKLYSAHGHGKTLHKSRDINDTLL